MSRFFKGDSSSESSSSDEEELYSEEEEEEEKEESSEEDEDEEEEDEDSSSDDEDGKKTGANAFLKSADSESDESSDEEGTKVVKSAKDKRIEELEGTVKAIENGQKINDWGSISAGMRFWDKDSVDQGLTYGY
jgi:translation initiation factor 3 subunit C